MEKEYRHNNKVAIYRSADGETQLSVEIDKDTVWLNANQMAELFGRDSKTIRKHINNAIREELAGKSGWSQNLRQPLNMVQWKLKVRLMM